MLESALKIVLREKKKGEERDTLDVPACGLGWLSDQERDFVYFCSAPR